MSEITKNVETFYKSIMRIPNHRYKSWEHCHIFFRRLKEEVESGKRLTEEDIDLASLHLAFYLASWGMYRGSSFVLQKDYTMYKEIILKLFDSRYLKLWENPVYLNEMSEGLEIFNDLYLEVKKELKKTKTEVIENHKDLSENKRKRFKKDATDILITKILLGTMACIPAYDRFFVAGLKVEKIQMKFKPEKAMSAMLSYYQKNKDEIDSLSENIKDLSGVKYPPMKIIDMYFWKVGEEAERKERAEKKRLKEQN